MSVNLFDTLRPAGNFPVADAKHIKYSGCILADDVFSALEIIYESIVKLSADVDALKSGGGNLPSELPSDTPDVQLSFSVDDSGAATFSGIEFYVDGSGNATLSNVAIDVDDAGNATIA